MHTQAGARTLTGATQIIQDVADTGEVCRVGDIIKYVNLFLECAPRQPQGAEQDRVGWLEWAFVCVKETETNVPITITGTQTLGVICNHMFRNECIYTGMMPVGATQSNSMPIVIKIPKTKQQIRIGDEWRFITWWRSSNSADVSTTAMRVVKSFMYKCYS